MQYNLGSCAGI